MSDQEQKQERTNVSPQPDAVNKKQDAALSEEELKKVSGGGSFEPPDPCRKP